MEKEKTPICNLDNPIHRTRCYLIIRELKRGVSAQEIADKYSSGEEGWGISALTIKQHFISAARKLMKEDIKENVANLREEQLGRYMDIYQEARDIGDIKAANSILQSIDKLYGLQSQKLDIDLKEYVIEFD